MQKNNLSNILDPLTIPARYCEDLGEGIVRCYACAHRCTLKPGQRGICKMRFNQDGILRVPWGYVAAAAIDPIEKKPFMHFLPGSSAMTFGMLGCQFPLRFLPKLGSALKLCGIQRRMFLDDILKKQHHKPCLHMLSRWEQPSLPVRITNPSSPANGRWIFSPSPEMPDCIAYMSSNGFATLEILHALQPYLHGFKIDLKCMSDPHYRDLGGNLQVVLDAIALAHELGMWVEVVTLVIPGFNDNNEDLWEMARYITSVSADIPWHVTSFYPTYKRVHTAATSVEILMRAADIGQEAGLRYVYAGNLPGRVGSLENTYCPYCNKLLVERHGYHISSKDITSTGNCPHCGKKIAGFMGVRNCTNVQGTFPYYLR